MEALKGRARPLHQAAQPVACGQSESLKTPCSALTTLWPKIGTQEGRRAGWAAPAPRAGLFALALFSAQGIYASKMMRGWGWRDSSSERGRERAFKKHGIETGAFKFIFIAQVMVGRGFLGILGRGGMCGFFLQKTRDDPRGTQTLDSELGGLRPGP